MFRDYDALYTLNIKQVMFGIMVTHLVVITGVIIRVLITSMVSIKIFQVEME